MTRAISSQDEAAPRGVLLATLGAGALSSVGLGAFLLWQRHGVQGPIAMQAVQAHALVVAGAFAIPLALALGPSGARWRRPLFFASLAVAAAGLAWAIGGVVWPAPAFDPIWHLGTFGVALPLVLRRIEAPLPRGFSWMYAAGVAITAAGLAMAGAPAAPVLVQAGRGLFTWALLMAALGWRQPRSWPAAIWILAASIATVVNAVRELAGGLPGEYEVSDAVRHTFTIGAILMPLLELAAPRARVPIVVLASLSAALRLGVIPVAYGPWALAPAGRILAVVSGLLGLAAVCVALWVVAVQPEPPSPARTP